MWDLPRPGIEPVSLALAGRFLSTVPPGKSLFLLPLITTPPPPLPPHHNRHKPPRLQGLAVLVYKLYILRIYLYTKNEVLVYKLYFLFVRKVVLSCYAIWSLIHILNNLSFFFYFFRLCFCFIFTAFEAIPSIDFIFAKLSLMIHNVDSLMFLVWETHVFPYFFRNTCF